MIYANVTFETESHAICAPLDKREYIALYDSTYVYPLSVLFHWKALSPHTQAKFLYTTLTPTDKHLVSGHSTYRQHTHAHTHVTQRAPHTETDAQLRDENHNPTHIPAQAHTTEQPGLFFPPTHISSISGTEHNDTTVDIEDELPRRQAFTNNSLIGTHSTDPPEPEPHFEYDSELQLMHPHNNDTTTAEAKQCNEMYTDDAHISEDVATPRASQELEEDTNEDMVVPVIMRPRVVVSVPLVSVIMTTYNCAKYLEFAIRSLQLQTLTNWELIVINDKSTDHSDSILRTIAQNDDRIVYLHNIHNLGCYASKNIALQYARGTWLTFHDADDHSMSERLEKQLYFCQNGKQSSINEQRSVASLTDLSYDCCYVTSLSRKSKIWSWVPITMFIRASVFRDQLGAFDSVRFGADTEIRYRMNILGIRVGVIDDYLYACPDRWLEVGGRDESLTGNTKHDPIRIKYKKAFCKYHQYVQQTRHPHHLLYSQYDAQHSRPFRVPLTEDEAQLFFPIYRHIQECLAFNQQCE